MSNNAKIYVGNFPYSTTEDQLKSLFSECGEVTDVNLIIDRATNRPKGFGFIEFATNEQAEAAVQKFNGHDLDGRPLRVSTARERQAGGGGSDRRGGGGGGNRRGGGGGNHRRGRDDDQRW